MAACRPLSDMHVDARQARAACGGLAALADEAARAAAAVPLLLERVLAQGAQMTSTSRCTPCGVHARAAG